MTVENEDTEQITCEESNLFSCHYRQTHNESSYSMSKHQEDQTSGTDGDMNITANIKIKEEHQGSTDICVAQDALQNDNQVRLNIHEGFSLKEMPKNISATSKLTNSKITQYFKKDNSSQNDCLRPNNTLPCNKKFTNKWQYLLDMQ